MRRVVFVLSMDGVLGAMGLVTISDGDHKSCIAKWYLKGVLGLTIPHCKKIAK